MQKISAELLTNPYAANDDDLEAHIVSFYGVTSQKRLGNGALN